MGSCCDKFQWKQSDDIVGAYRYKRQRCGGQCCCCTQTTGFYPFRKIEHRKFTDGAKGCLEDAFEEALNLIQETEPRNCCCCGPCVCRCPNWDAYVKHLNEKWAPEVNKRLRPFGIKVDAFHFWIWVQNGLYQYGMHREDFLLIRVKVLSDDDEPDVMKKGHIVLNQPSQTSIDAKIGDD
mmetsp:Transcript_17565/g.35446  ORF Transcript_17565/g.35446 Transcript_17565/m.35446 type:complete len:180 (-) Transcript_17565:203-742(-)